MVRVFVNHVDTYKGKAISKVPIYLFICEINFNEFCQFKAFASAVVGASLEEEVEDVQPSGDSSTGNQNLYEVIGTLSDELNEKPSWISEIIPVSLCS